MKYTHYPISFCRTRDNIYIHAMKRFLLLYILVFTLGVSCKDAASDVDIPRIQLGEDQVTKLMSLPLKCIHQEYPNKLNQVLGDSSHLGPPSELHPAFYGCFDWHSAVHGHWLLVSAMRHFPGNTLGDSTRSILKSSLSEDNIRRELDYFKRGSESAFERTYGWAWLLKLSEELYLWEDSLGKELHQNLEPLTQHIVASYKSYLPKLLYPIRSGEHSNSAFGMRLALEYAKTVGDEELVELIKERSLEFYLEDGGCPLNWEPGGHDFLSPCLEEMYLMDMVLDSVSFDLWGRDFLPEIYKRDFELAPGVVSDRTDGKLVHLDGLNFSRAWCLYALSESIADLRHLRHLANLHMEASIDNLVDGAYSGEHWLASFAMMALYTP